MNLIKFFLPALIATGLAAIDAPIDAQYTFTPETGNLEVEGTSTVHDWTCTAEDFDGTAYAGASDSDTPLTSLEDVTFTVPSTALECGNGTMNRKTRGALDAENHPEISFVMDSSEVLSVDEDGMSEVAVSGRLIVAGVERPIELTVVAQPTVTGTFRVRGSVPLTMTDFDVKPPRAMLGVLKTGDDVTVHFELTARRDSGA